jgi:hypothetical protein
MYKIYRLTLTFLLLILLSANIMFFAYDGELMTHFKMDSPIESSEAFINEFKLSVEDKEEKPFFDLSLLNTSKFNNLTEFKVDVSDIELPGVLDPEEDEDGEEVGVEEPLVPDFEIGNINPFSQSF